MSKSFTPTYIVIYEDQTGTHKAAWDTKQAGRPNLTNLMQYRRMFNDSMKFGGCNFHVSKALGFLLSMGNAKIVNQRTGDTICTFKMPLFELI
jgi:hypothetical protein